MHISEGTTGATLYVETTRPGDWSDLESSCQSSSGHLVSFNDPAVEEAVAESTELDSFWCGGNMCPDSPGKKIIIKNCHLSCH